MSMYSTACIVCWLLLDVTHGQGNGYPSNIQRMNQNNNDKEYGKPNRRTKSLCKPEDIVGDYYGTGICDFGPDEDLLQISGENNRIEMGYHTDDLLQNTVTAGDFLEVEHCTKDSIASSVYGSPVYDCITISRNDMANPNVILRYSFNSDCSSFDKLVRVLPGNSVDNEGNEIKPHICKITAVKVEDNIGLLRSEANPSKKDEKQLLVENEEEVKEAASDVFDGMWQPDGSTCNYQTSMSVECLSSCCEGGKCVPKKKDWAKVPYCPRICRGSPFGSRGTC